METIEAHCPACRWSGAPDDLRASLGGKLVCPCCGKPGVRVEWADQAAVTWRDGEAIHAYRS